MGLDSGNLEPTAAAGRLIGRDARSAWAAVLLVILFCAVSLGIVAAGRGIPAVFDGNETFSSILHARNLLTFGPEKSVGLADESTSPWPQGHPVIHTHQGNFPRLYAAVLYALGLSGPTSQILATALPVGIASVLLLFVALRRFAGLGVAFASIVFLLTDYILFAQWQVVTYRIWHFAFTTALLALAILYRSDGRRWVLAMAFMTSFFLFYYELVFAVFLSVSIATFMLFQSRRDIAKGVLFVGAQVAGAACGISVLVAQLTAYLGWEGFVTDLEVTYVSRNVAAPEQLAALRAFVEQHNIAFMYNFANPIAHDLKRLLLDSVFRWGLQAYTPPFAYCIVIFAAGLAIALFARPGRVRSPRTCIFAAAAMTILAWLFGASGVVLLAVIVAAVLLIFVAPDKRFWAQTIGSADAAMLLGAPAFLFILMALNFSDFAGFARGAVSFWLAAVAFGASIAILFSVLLVRAVPQRDRPFTLDAVLRGTALFCVAIAFARFHVRLYDASLAPLWRLELPGPFVPGMLEIAGMVLATVYAALLAMVGPALPDTVLQPLRRMALRVAALIGSFLVGLLTVAVLSPGYLYSGYLVRYLNPLALCFALGVGLVVVVALVIGRHLVTDLGRRARGRWRVMAQPHFLPLALFAAWWAALQVADARVFPPRELAVLDALQSSLPKRPTIVSNSFSDPFSVATGQWAFWDETFSAGRTAYSPQTGYRYLFDKKYLWVADRDNLQYEKPDLFLCLIPSTFRSAADRLVGAENGTRCSENRVVQYAEQGKAVWPRPAVIARDPSARDGWAIVKLDWDFPPYLGARPAVTAAAAGDAGALEVTYDYRQQDGKPEKSTDLEIWPIARNGATCALSKAPVAAAEAAGGIVTLSLPRAVSELVALARPRTETRSGAPFFSLPFHVEQGAVVAADRPCNTIIDADKRVWPQAAGG